MRGAQLGLLPGVQLAYDQTAHVLLLQGSRGLLSLDRPNRRLRPVPRGRRVGGCLRTDKRVGLLLFVCGRNIETRFANVRAVVGPPGAVGHWVWAAFAPRGDAILAQWSAECEVPVAFLVVHGAVRPYGGRSLRDAPSSVALGWLPDGRAAIHFPRGACGGSYRLPGIYAVPRLGRPELFRRTRGGTPTQRFAMWGG